MNDLALMRLDHHVHWHVIPRYDGPRTFAGREWVDRGWPRHPAMADSQHGDDAVLHEIRRALRGGSETKRGSRRTPTPWQFGRIMN